MRKGIQVKGRPITRTGPEAEAKREWNREYDRRNRDKRLEYQLKYYRTVKKSGRGASKGRPAEKLEYTRLDLGRLPGEKFLAVAEGILAGKVILTP